MLCDGINLIEGSVITNLTVANGNEFPNSPNVGELFYRTDTNELYSYSGTTWTSQGSGGGAGGSSFTITGDVTGIIDGEPDVLTLANVNLNAGSYGTEVYTPTFTVNNKGLITDVINTLIEIPETQVVDGYLLARLADNETVTGSWRFNNPVAGALPTQGTHLTTKEYVDTFVAGVTVHEAARVATTTNITLNGTQTIDGISVQVGDRVLVKNQADGSKNGIYVASPGTWTRAADYDGSQAAEVRSGDFIFVLSGTVGGNMGWVLITPNPIILGQTALNFTQMSNATSGVVSIAGTANQVFVSSSTGPVTLSLPQNINLGAAPAFAGTNFTNIPNAALAYSSITINGTPVSLGSSTSVSADAGSLSGETLAANVVNSSLTSVGILSSLRVSGPMTVGTNSGTFTISTPVTTAGGQVGGSISIVGGQQNNTSSSGGNVSLIGGSASALNTDGGNVILSAGTGIRGGALVFNTAASGVLAERFRILNNGAWSVGADGVSYGTAGHVLTSNGNAPPTWQVPGGASAAAGTLTGTTLAANVVNSSLTSVGTLSSLQVSGTITGGGVGGSISSPAILLANNQYLTFLDNSGGTSAAGALVLDTSNHLTIVTSSTPRVWFRADGAWGLGSSATVGIPGQVLTSNGSGAAPRWTSAGSGTVSSVAVSSTDLSISGSPITTSGTITLNINSAAVTNVKLANVPSGTFKGRSSTTPGAGEPTDLTGTQATALLNTFTSTLKGLVPASGGSARQYLRADGGFAEIATFTPTLSGFVPASGGGTTKYLCADGTFSQPATGGSGTVTSVSVTTANGVSGTVATPNTNPAITLTLGAITPSSVAATGTVSGSNLTGTNTGDQTITLTGDVTGTGSGSFAATLSTVNTNTGSFGSSTSVPVITVDGKGRITAISTTPASAGSANLLNGTDNITLPQTTTGLYAGVYASKPRVIFVNSNAATGKKNSQIYNTGTNLVWTFLSDTYSADLAWMTVGLPTNNASQVCPSIDFSATTISLIGATTQAGALNLSGAASPLKVQGSAGTSGQVLMSAGAGATPTWTTPLATNATNLVGGAANQIPYQSAASTTAFGGLLSTTNANVMVASDIAGSTIGGALTLGAPSAGVANVLTLANTRGLAAGEGVGISFVNNSTAGTGYEKASIRVITEGAPYNGALIFSTGLGTPGTYNSGTMAERMRITGSGGISFGASGTAYGTSGQVLTSNGNAPPTWQAASGGTASTLANATTLGTVTNAATSITPVTGTTPGTFTISQASSSSGTPGLFTISGGNSTSGSLSGDLTITAGNGNTGANSSIGGALTLRGGTTGTNVAAVGGAVIIQGGTAGINGGAVGGAVTIAGGLGGNAGAAGGAIILQTAPSLAATAHVERLRILANGAWSVGTGGAAYGTAGQVLTSNGNAAPTWATLSSPYDLGLTISGRPDGGAKVLSFVAVRAFTIPSSFTGSRAVSGTTAFGAAVFTINKNGASIGTVQFAAASSTGTFSGSAGAFAIGDVLTITAPASRDATLADISLVLITNLN
jgi:hypothetical protein